MKRVSVILLLFVGLCVNNSNAQINRTPHSPYLENYIYDEVDTTRVSDFYAFAADKDAGVDINRLKGDYDLVAMLLLDDDMAERFLDVDESHIDYDSYRVLKNQYKFFSTKVSTGKDVKFYKVSSAPDKTSKENLLYLLSEEFDGSIMDSVCQPPEGNSLVLTISIRDSVAVVHVKSIYRPGFSKYYIKLEHNHLVVIPITETIDYEEKVEFAKKDLKINILRDEYVKKKYRRRINEYSYGLGIRAGVGMSKICNLDKIADPFYTHGMAYTAGVIYNFPLRTSSKAYRFNGDNALEFNNFFMQGGLFYTNLSSYFKQEPPLAKQVYNVNSFNLHLIPFGYRCGFGNGNSIDFSLGFNLGLIYNQGLWKIIPGDDVRFTYGLIASVGTTIVDYISLSLNYSIASSTFDSYAYAFYSDYPVAQGVLTFNVGFNFGPLMKKDK